jgi:hypothetical protein
MTTFISPKELYLSKHPYDRNVFVMMKYSQDRYHALIDSNIKHAFKEVDFFNPVLAKDLAPAYFHTIADAIRNSSKMCRYGVAVFSSQAGTNYNPNVAFELGIMWEQNKDILILKDRRVSTLFSDILGAVYKEFDGDIDELRVDNNELYVGMLDWLSEMKRIQLDSLDIVFVTTIEANIDNPQKAIAQFEEQLWKCVKKVAKYAHLTIPENKTLRDAIFFLYKKRQITTFIYNVMHDCANSCHRLKRVTQFSQEDRNYLLSRASTIRDIYNDWLRHYSYYRGL